MKTEFPEIQIDWKLNFNHKMVGILISEFISNQINISRISTHKNWLELFHIMWLT